MDHDAKVRLFIFIPCFLIFIFSVLFVVRTRQPLVVSYERKDLSGKDVWQFVSNQEITLLDTPEIIPSIKGSWYKKEGFFGVYSIEFDPSENWKEGITYTVRMPAARVYSETQLPFSAIAFTTSISEKNTEPVPETVQIEEPKSIITQIPKTSMTNENSEKITQSEIIKLKVPYFMQAFDRSCEEAALRMALAYYGIETTDWDILQKVGYDPKPKDTTTNTWDDPNKMFVGFVSKADGPGYGVFSGPIAEAAKAYGRDATAYTNVSPEFLAQQIFAGYPVVIWGYMPQSDTAGYVWNIFSGGEANAYRGEHARTLVGVAGPIDHPIGFYVHDPLSGKAYEYWTRAKLVSQMSLFGALTNQAVVVR